MTTKTVTIGGDGAAITVTKDDDDGPVEHSAVTIAPGVITLHRHHGFDPGSFMAGLFLMFFLMIAFRYERRRRRHRPVEIATREADAAHDQSRMAADVAALARRTATLETIVTDPAQRTAREIDALR